MDAFLRELFYVVLPILIIIWLEHVLQGLQRPFEVNLGRLIDIILVSHYLYGKPGAHISYMPKENLLESHILSLGVHQDCLTIPVLELVAKRLSELELGLFLLVEALVELHSK